MKVLSKNNKVLLADGQAVKGQSGGVEQVEWHQCADEVKAFILLIRSASPRDLATISRVIPSVSDFYLTSGRQSSSKWSLWVCSYSCFGGLEIMILQGTVCILRAGYIHY